MSSDKSSIVFKPDHELDLEEGQATKRYSVLDANGNKEQFTIGLWNGESMEFFLAHNVVELNSYFECLTDNGHAWTWGQRFKSLEHTLTGDALVNWKELMVEDYPDPADKTQPNYVKAIKDLITKLSEVTYPGEPLKEYMWKIVYSRCKDNQGKQLPPNKVFSRLKRMRAMGGQMHHTAPAGQPFISDTDFLKMFYNIFPREMKTFVENMKDCDPFNGITTIDDVCEHFSSYYKMHLKDGKEHKRKRDDDDNKDKKPSHVRGGGNKNDKRFQGKPKHQHKAAKGSCHIGDHAGKYFHDWRGCFLNPFSDKFDRAKADEFYRNEAKGNMAWYKNVYEAKFGGSNNRYNNRDGYHGGGGRGGYHRDQGGRGRGNGGRGNNGRGNGGRGNGGRGNYDTSHYNHDNSYHYQGNYNYQGQHQQQRNDQGNGGTNNVPPPQEGYYFGGPEAPPSAPMAPRDNYDRRNAYNGGGRW